MKLYLIIGPMFSGKTSYIIQKYNPINSIAIKPLIDNRYSNRKIISHNNITIPCLSIDRLINFEKKVNINNLYNIFIDEGQFFSDLNDFIKIMEHKNINIYISALNSDFKRQPFLNITTLYARADKIVYKQGKCKYCDNKSSFTWKIKNNFNLLQIDVGGIDKYHPVCGNCYEDFLKKSSCQQFSSAILPIY